MIAFIKRNLFIIILFLLTLLLSFITFLTFIGRSFIELNQQNLQFVLILNIAFLLLFFVLIFVDVKNSIKNNINVRGLSLIHISEPTRPLYISYAVFCLKKKNSHDQYGFDTI